MTFPSDLKAACTIVAFSMPKQAHKLNDNGNAVQCLSAMRINGPSSKSALNHWGKQNKRRTKITWQNVCFADCHDLIKLSASAFTSTGRLIDAPTGCYFFPARGNIWSTGKPSIRYHHHRGPDEPAADTRQIVESSRNTLANTTGILVSVKVFPKEGGLSLGQPLRKPMLGRK